jgi:hypothetical protein
MSQIVREIFLRPFQLTTAEKEGLPAEEGFDAGNDLV